MSLVKTFGHVLAWILVVAFVSPRVNSEIAPLHIKSDENSIPGHYIVVLKDDVDVKSFTSSLETWLRDTSEGKIRYTYEHALKGFSAQLSEYTLKKLRDSEHVKYIEEDGIERALSVSSWGLDRVDQRTLSLDDTTPSFLGDGSNTHMYIIDSGTMATHTEFSGRMSDDGFDAINRDEIGVDCTGHGTHCGGTAAGATYGVASKATVYSVRVLGCDGSGTTSGVVSGMDWVAANANLPAVASMSLGGSNKQSKTDAVNSLVSAGVVVSVAAGNANVDACNTSPASVPAAITVAATDKSDKRADFSNYGSCVDIFAPGVDIVSAYISSNTATKTLDGTSMACPHVSGAAAVLLSIDGTLTPEQVADQLVKAATPYQVSDVKSSPNRLLYIGKDTCLGVYVCSDMDPSRNCQCDTNCGDRVDCCMDYPYLFATNECYTDNLGKDYRGQVQVTVSGKICQKWTEQSPYKHTFTPDKYPEAGLGSHNYCRNPDGDSRPWCITTDASVSWDYCNVGTQSGLCRRKTLKDIIKPAKAVPAMIKPAKAIPAI